MLTEKLPQTVVSFPDITAAVAMEKACQLCGLPGRIIPVPNQITAGCGFAWRADAGLRGDIENLLAEKSLAFDRVYTLEL